MPNCFRLIFKGTGEPMKFAEVDDRLCDHLGVEPDEKHYYKGWYDSVGMVLALGQNWAEVRETFKDCGLDEVIDWLEDNFTVECWYQHGW